MARSTAVQVPRKSTAILQKYYVYDPGVSGDLGGLLVKNDDDDKGAYVLSSAMVMQYWIDQGLAGLAPLGELSEPQKKLLAQITRGRSEAPDEEPTRVPKYSKVTQSGAPSFAAMSPAVASRRKKKTTKKTKDDKKADPKKRPQIPEPTRVSDHPEQPKTFRG